MKFFYSRKSSFVRGLEAPRDLDVNLFAHRAWPIMAVSLILSVTAAALAQAPAVTVRVAPFTSCLLPSQTEQYAAVVGNTANTGVTWSVDNIVNGSVAVGTITSGGLYTAPPTVGNHTIMATSQADPTVIGRSSLTIKLTRFPFGVFPSSATVLVSTDQTFQAQVCSVPDSNVTFTVDGIPGGDATSGTITNAGVYTAPAQPGKHALAVTDTSLNITASAAATVYTNVSADFSARKNQVYPIPPDLFGANRADDLHNSADLALLAGAVSSTRTNAQIPSVFGTPTPDWSRIDPKIKSLLAAGIRPILQLVSTPGFLLPSPNPCNNTSAPPTDFNRWGQIAAMYVAHMDATFKDGSGKPFIQDYEIWNEPDTGALCGSHLSDYLNIYAAAAPQMRAQAAQDGATIRIGGPATSSVNSIFISGVTTDPRTAPYVDFISYHNYLFGFSSVGSNFDTFSGIQSYYQKLQSSAQPSFAAAVALARSGKQPLGINTPIYVDEFNTNKTNVADCCRNDAMFSPVYNGLNAVDLLDVVYAGAPQVPGKITYFAANTSPAANPPPPSYICLIGVPDSLMDCQYPTGSVPQPYPQYYVYQLLTSTSFLGLRDGGFMAPAVSPPVSGGGLAVSAFYTATQDTIFIVNPTALPYPGLQVEADNTGYTAATGTLYQIQNGQSITSSAPTLTVAPGETTYTAAVDVPPYSVLALAIQGTPDPNLRSVQILVSAAPEPSVYPAGFTVSATVSALNASSNNPTGTIAFSVDGVALGGAVRLNSTGIATAKENSALSPGGHVITAAYSGDNNFDAATFSGPHAVDTIPTTTTEQAAPNPTSFGTQAVFTANVTSAGPSGPIPGVGNVTFDDGQNVRVVPLDGSGNAVYSTSTLPVGSHTVSATYSGEAKFAVTGASVIEVITPAVIAPTTTTLTSSLNPAPFQQSVTFTATVAAGTTPAVGQVSFKDGATPLGTVTLNASGVATLTTSTLAIGSHPITASYGGGVLFAPSTGTLTQIITTQTTTTLSSSLNPSTRGQNVTFTATVTGVSGVPTGTVNFLDSGAVLGSGTLSPLSVATFSTTSLSVGTHTITAAYQGDTVFIPSTSAPVSQVVILPPDFALQITPPLITAFRGINATYGVTLTSISSFNNVVDFTCSVGGAPLTTCSLSPTALTGTGNTILSVKTSFAHAQNRTAPTTLVMASLLGFLLLRRKRWQSSAFLLLVLLAGISGLSGCGSNGNLGTTPGTYTITVTGTSTLAGAPLIHTATARLRVQ